MRKKGLKDNKKINPQKQGNDFEDIFCEFITRFIRDCFQIESFIDDPIRQNAGSQYGRDITARWKSIEKVDFKWWFECKSHMEGKKGNKEIHQREVSDKIIELLIHDSKPSCFCIVSPHIEPNTWLKEKISSINAKVEKVPEIIWWTPKTTLSIKKAIGLYPDIWEKIYGGDVLDEFLIDNEEEKKRYLEDIKEEFTNRNKKGIYSIEIMVSNNRDKKNKGKIVHKKEILNEELVKEAISIDRQIEFYDPKNYE